MKDKITQYFKSVGEPCTVKYIDPSYMVRSVPANAADSIYCSLLAQNAVHGAMAGFTQFTVVSNRFITSNVTPEKSVSPFLTSHFLSLPTSLPFQGLCNNRLVYLPIPLVVATSPRIMDPVGRTWERVLSVTRQPNTAVKLSKNKVTSAKTFL